MADNHVAINANGNRYWFQNHLLHRTDGPAIEYRDGAKSWFIDGKQYTFKQWLAKCSLSDEEKCELVLIYG